LPKLIGMGFQPFNDFVEQVQGGIPCCHSILTRPDRGIGAD
jgi:hypothetical protein